MLLLQPALCQRGASGGWIGNRLPAGVRLRHQCGTQVRGVADASPHRGREGDVAGKWPLRGENQGNLEEAVNILTTYFENKFPVPKESQQFLNSIIKNLIEKCFTTS